MNKNFFSTDNKERVNFVLKCAAVYIISIFALMRSDFRYIDDIGRTFTGDVSGWNVYNRYFAEVICKVMSASRMVTDTSPFSQMATMLMMAVAVMIIISMTAPKDLKSNWSVIAAVPFAVSPYFMENISYKIECIIHGTSVLISVLPLPLYKRENWKYILSVFCCSLLMCMTYQAAGGVFPVVVVMAAAVQWNNGDNLRDIFRFVSTSVMGYLSGLLFFKLLIMKPVNTWVSSEMLSFKEIPVGVLYNLLAYYKTMVSDFKISWIGLIAIISIAFILVYTATSNRKKAASFFVATMSLLLMGSLCFGFYPLLKSPLILPRTMYGVGIVLSMLCIFIVSRAHILCKIPVFLIAWCFVTFASNYGNCLALQQEYTDIRLQAVVDYLNLNYDKDVPYVLEIEGDIGKAPAIRKQISSNRLLSKLVPRTLGGGWNWSMYKLFMYCGLPDNFRPVWPGDRSDEEYDLVNKNLPFVSDCMWFDVYSDGNNILIQLKD